MWLWAVLTVIVGVVAAAMTVPLVRRHEARLGNRGTAAAALAEQLADIDTQVAGGAVDAAEADALRTEAKRRMLGAARVADQPARPLGGSALGRLAIGLAAVVAVATVALYSTLGRPDLANTATPATATPAAATAPPSDTEIASMVTQLEKRMADNPGDAEGWRMLGWSYFQTQRYAEAATAYGKAVKLAPAGPGYASAYGEALVQAANGTVSPEARAQFDAARRLDPNDARARYFGGLAKDQSGDHQGALDDWLALLATAPADAPWAGELRRVIGEAAAKAGIDVSARLAAAAPAVTTAPNPSADQVAAVKAMAPQAQQAMIRGMVDNLAAKLKANPKDPAGWVRLIRARTVLGDAAAARQAKADGLAALKGDAAGIAAIEQGQRSRGSDPDAIRHLDARPLTDTAG